MSPRTRLALDVALLALVTFASFRLYRSGDGVPQMTDACYSLAVSQRLVEDGKIGLGPHVPTDPAALKSFPGYALELGRPYHLIRLKSDPDGGFYYGYPLGSSVLSAPLVAYYAHGRGFSAFDAAGLYSLEAETKLHLRVTAVVTAACVGVIFLIARSFLPAVIAAAFAFGFATATMAWSTLSRCLWSHTWTVLLTALAVLILVRLAKRTAATLRGDLLAGVGLGVLMVAIYLTRPQAALTNLGILAFLIVWYRRTFLIAGVSAALTGGIVAAICWPTFGTLTPPTVYSPGSIDWLDTSRRFVGILVSPSRGLLVFCPYLVIFLYLLAAYRRSIPCTRLMLPAGVAVLGYVVVFTGYEGWHAGYSYGPRYFSDVLPWFALGGVLAIAALLEAPASRVRKGIETGVLLLCIAWGIFVHSRPAVSMQAWEWNYSCRTDDEHIRLVTDWNHPQFLAGLTYRVASDGSFDR